MKALSIFILCCFYGIILDASQPHHTTAFIGNPCELETLWSYSHYQTDHFWNQQHEKLPSYNDFKSDAYLLYAEYSLSRKNSVFFNGGYLMAFESLNGNSRGLTDMEWGWKHLFFGDEECALTSQVIAVSPGGEKKSSIRYGRPAFQIGFLYSQIFDIYRYASWCDFSFAYRFYTGYPSDQVRVEGAFGVVLSDMFTAIFSGNWICGLFDGNPDENLNFIVNHPNYRLLNLQAECVVNLISHVSLSFGVYGHAWGQNVGTGGGGFCGLWIYF